MHPCEPFRSGAPHAYFAALCTPVEERCSKPVATPALGLSPRLRLRFIL